MNNDKWKMNQTIAIIVYYITPDLSIIKEVTCSCQEIALVQLKECDWYCETMIKNGSGKNILNGG